MALKARVDIIIPVYNVSLYVARCLESVIAQTVTDWRAICIDDGSTDNSLEILNRYAASDERILVVHKPNGGLSSARNAGMAVSDAEFVMFIDSDDFIHPQTLEIALALSERDGSDIVSWYRDSSYRNIQVKLLRKLGKDDISAKPWHIDRRYDIASVKSVVTDNILEHCSDWNHPDIPFALKRNWVWRHLFRRSAIEGISFIEGLNYEDIPWWAEVILTPRKATITKLPLYYYYPNRKSITKSTAKADKQLAPLKGLQHAFEIYRQRGTDEQNMLWNHNFKWAVVCRMAAKLHRIYSPELDRMLKELWIEGFFDDAYRTSELLAKERIAHACRYTDLIANIRNSRYRRLLSKVGVNY